MFSANIDNYCLQRAHSPPAFLPVESGLYNWYILQYLYIQYLAVLSNRSTRLRRRDTLYPNLVRPSNATHTCVATYIGSETTDLSVRGIPK